MAKSKPKSKTKVSKRKAVKKNTAVDLFKEVWAQERHVLSRPDRLQYVRRLFPPNHCVFCAAEKKGVGVDSLVLAQTPHALIMLNKFPYNSGHLLVLPRRHVGHLLELEEKEYQEVQAQIRRALQAVEKAYQCTGLNVGLNHGQVAGAGIPDHLHWHVIPRWAGDTNFFPLIAESKVVIETVEQTFDRLIPHFRE